MNDDDTTHGRTISINSSASRTSDNHDQAVDLPASSAPRSAKLLSNLTVGLNEWVAPIAIADPHRHDCPLIFVNDSFCALTEYAREEVLGRNCRFLQPNPGDPAARAELRATIRAGSRCATLIPNVTKSGRPFRNLLTMETVNIPNQANLIVASQFELRVSPNSVSERAIAMMRTGLTIDDVTAPGAAPDDPIELEWRSFALQHSTLMVMLKMFLEGVNAGAAEVRRRPPRQDLGGQAPVML